MVNKISTVEGEKEVLNGIFGYFEWLHSVYNMCTFSNSKHILYLWC